MQNDPLQGIRSVSYEKNSQGQIVRLRVIFGPHHFLEILAEPSGETKFVLGATHHGVLADASRVGGELDEIIKTLRNQFSEQKVDGFPIWEGRQV